MNRRSVAIGGITAVSLIAGGIVAAALTHPTPRSRTRGTGPGGGSGGSGVGGPPPASGEPLQVVTVPWIGEVILFLLAVSILLIIVYVAVYRQEYLPLLGTILVVSLAVFVILEVFVTSTADDTLLFDLISLVTGGSTSGPGADMLSGRDVTFLLVLVVSIIALAVVVSRSRWMKQDRSKSPLDDEARSEPDTETIASIAGRTADRLESNTGFENEVFQAWREMTRLLTVTRAESMTPGEFAREAIAVGMQPSDVNDLTRLFEDVRYGGYEPTNGREERARQLFRRIETTYGSPEQ